MVNLNRLHLFNSCCCRYDDIQSLLICTRRTVDRTSTSCKWQIVTRGALYISIAYPLWKPAYIFYTNNIVSYLLQKLLTKINEEDQSRCKKFPLNIVLKLFALQKLSPRTCKFRSEKTPFQLTRLKSYKVLSDFQHSELNRIFVNGFRHGVATRVGNVTYSRL